MFARVLLSGAIALGLIATGAVAVTDPARAKVFQGKTVQGYKIKLSVKDSRFKILRFEADLRCRNGVTLTLIESGFLWTAVRDGGSFRDAQFGKTDEVYFRGRMTERRVRGRVRLEDRLRRGVKCRSRWIAFNATPR